MDKPETITRLNSKQEYDSLLEDAFKRLSEREKIFCSKQMNSFIEDVAEDQFILQINYSSAQRIKTNNTAGTRRMAQKHHLRIKQEILLGLWNCYLIFVGITILPLPKEQRTQAQTLV